jgi:hypothetical protein
MSKNMNINLPDMSFKLNETSKRVDVCNKIITILLSTKQHSIDDTKKLCNQLFDMPSDSRSEFVNKMWGQIALSKIEPLLIQLNVFK